jgi:hypothetical protein
MPKGFAGMDVPAIDPALGYCHPRQSKRTRCACGAVVVLGRDGTVCGCGRVHVKEPGAAFGSTGLQPVRAGGRRGCPGVS